MRRVMKILLVITAVYVALLVMLLVVQRRLIYLPQSLDPGEWRPRAPGRIVRFESADGTRLSGLFIPPPDDEKPVLLITHGNAGNIRGWSDQLYGYAELGFGGLLLDPRGYGLSEGSPDEEGCVADGEAALRWLENEGFPAGRVALHGISIGSGIAVPLAARHAVRALILQSPFTDLPATAQRIFFFVPCRLLIHDTYDNLALAPDIDVPTLVIHGSRDHTIPIEQGRRLAQAFATPARFIEVPGWGHNGLHGWNGYWKEIEAFLR